MENVLIALIGGAAVVLAAVLPVALVGGRHLRGIRDQLTPPDGSERTLAEEVHETRQEAARVAVVLGLHLRDHGANFRHGHPDESEPT